MLRIQFVSLFDPLLLSAGRTGLEGLDRTLDAAMPFGLLTVAILFPLALLSHLVFLPANILY